MTCGAVKNIAGIVSLCLLCYGPVRTDPEFIRPDCLSGKMAIDKDFFRKAYETLYAGTGSGGVVNGMTEKAVSFYRRVAADGWQASLPDPYARKRFTVSALPGLIGFLSDTIKNKKILSIGSGRAELESSLAKSGNNELVCLDALPEMVDQARMKGLSAFLNTGPRLNFESARFDMVIFPYSISLMKDLTTMLGEASRVMKNEGKLVIINPLFRTGQGGDSGMAEKGFYNREELCALLEKNGFLIFYAPKTVMLPPAYGSETLPVVFIVAVKSSATEKEGALSVPAADRFVREYVEQSV